ncbi:MAG: domain/GAF domain/GGDEF domain protein [Myxococcaceae bacterium]|nr:domain/GAF domain/GGDEF domain protein [Myxococcaceae bacterium]
MLPLPEVREDESLARQLSRAFRIFAGLAAGALLIMVVTYGASWAWLTPEYERSRIALVEQAKSYARILDEQSGGNQRSAARDLPEKASESEGELSITEALVNARVAEKRWRDQRARASTDRSAEAAAEGQALFHMYRDEQAALTVALELRSHMLYRRGTQLAELQLWLVLVVFATMFFLALYQHRALRNSIVVPVAALLRHIRYVRDGELEANIVPSGPMDLRQLGAGLNDMARALTTARDVADSRDEALREHSTRLRRILEASREFSESLNLRYVVGAVRESTAALGGYDKVIVWLMDDEQKCLIDSDEYVGGAEPPAVPANGVKLGRGLAGRAAKSGRIMFEGQAGKVLVSTDDAEPVRAIAIPLIVGARVVGALEGRNTTAAVASKDKVEVLEMLATHAATAIESARLHEVIEQRSQVDTLTRLCNRGCLDDDLEAECIRSVRYGRPLAFVMLDVDHFKAFNDAHGHPRADVALQQVASILAGCLRAGDTAYRYGGEEFCVILRETTGVDAMHFAERVRRRIEQHFTGGAEMGITASFGVADFSAETPAPGALVQAADTAMYESKNTGRNRVSLSSRPPPLLSEIHD